MDVSSTVSLLLWTVFLCPLTYGLYAFIRFYIDFKRRTYHIDKLFGRKPHFLWGNVHEFPGPTEKGLTFMKDVSYPVKDGMGRFYFGPLVVTVGTFHPKTVKAIMKTSDPKPRQFGGYFNIFPWLGDGLLLSGGEKWARNRRLLTPAFHFDILRPYMTVNNKCTDIFLNKLNEFSRKDEYFEVFTHISLLTLDIIMRCAFSYENDCQVRGDSHPYVKAVNKLQEAVVYRLLHPHLYPTVLFNLSITGRQFNKNCRFVHDVADEIVAQRRAVLNKQTDDISKKGRYLDFLDILLTAKDEDGRGLSDLEIRDEVDTFLFEGHDTTASGISWTLFSLAQNPKCQQKCQEEIDEILKDRPNKDIEWDDLPQLKYVTQCIKEALRLHTPVPFIQRQTTKDMDVDGHLIPAGTIVDVHLYLVHHNPFVWEDPEVFDPDRFSADNMQKMDSFAFIAFSAGPRNCIGQQFAMHEMKSVVARILSRFTLTVKPGHVVEHRVTVIMKPENGMYLKATPREELKNK